MLWSVGCIIDMFESEFSVHKPFIIAMPEGHPLAGESRIRVALLADEPLIASSVELELGFGGQIHEIEAEGKFVPRIVNRAPDIPTILCLVAAGMGCAFVPASFGEWPCQALLIVNSLGPSEMRCWRPPAAKTIRRRQ